MEPLLPESANILLVEDLAAGSGFTNHSVMANSIAQMHPIPRLGQAQDAAALAAFLLGPESSWITKQVLALDGGRSTLRIKG